MVTSAHPRMVFALTALLLCMSNNASADNQQLLPCHRHDLYVGGVWIVGHPPAPELDGVGVFTSSFEIPEDFVFLGFTPPYFDWLGCRYVQTYWRDPTETSPLPDAPAFEISFADFREIYNRSVEELPGEDWRLWQFTELSEGWRVVEIDNDYHPDYP